MNTNILNKTDLLNEIEFQTSRSGGSGGQNVNKVETKVALRLDITNSVTLSEEQKALILEKLKNRITNEGILVLSDQTSRSQLKNRDMVIEKLFKLLDQAFHRQKSRKPSKPTYASKLKRLQEKQKKSIVKSLRKRPFEE